MNNIVQQIRKLPGEQTAVRLTYEVNFTHINEKGFKARDQRKVAAYSYQQAADIATIGYTEPELISIHIIGAWR